MSIDITFLSSADGSEWTEERSEVDGLPMRESGPWISTKHRLLTYYAKMFSTGMKFKWASRVYLELFAGPGKCFVRDTRTEDLGSPLKVIDHEFTKFILIERNETAAHALATRLEANANADRVEIWCGDCAQAIHEIRIPKNSLTFAFIDPTGIAQAPFSLIEALDKATRCDLLINVQHGMGIKMNIHNYKPEAAEGSALSAFLGSDEWTVLPQNSPREFFIGVLELYKKRLQKLGYKFIGSEVMVQTNRNLPLYLLLFASRHPKGKEFWEKSKKGVLHPELF
jgi:three-Cys-motif partner protein